ncbi:hypothetical protein DQD37_01905 [Salmonella enterica subsp. enterica serovar Cardoner]|uniref:Uncharacterized protein n=1 Tax=Salmonella enterica subsp. enterica serovar Cardoner TaxID=2564309 RepID=A0A5W3RHM1_SALET|nr:hypothetical protein [Salmonella enterica subsp. enterica serovar Cardoner]EBW7241904.1 hypothetical protein [Salmonella enterica subsp. enterica serovar Cardoner]EBY8534640.1 hypothetical protein [Salmonella enterica subsp. enterica serovar Telelkebir]EHA9093043.1 hypothetical protein [Salmonella enterica subsp. enterica serovar Telelkebir]EKY8002572.1 hypothetical protein [Salmonella enterica]
MVMSVTLPNGVIMKGVPDGTSQIDIAKHAISKGYAAPIDFEAYPAIYSELTADKQQPEKEYKTTTAPVNNSGVNQLDTQAVTNSLMNAGIAHVEAAQNDGLTPTEEDMKGGKDASQYAWDTLLLSQPEVRLAMEGLPLAGKAAIGALTNSLTGAATHGTTENLKEDALVGAGGEVVGKVLGVAWDGLSPVAKRFFSRFSPRTAATVKGVADGGALDEAAEREVDAPTRSEKITTVEQGADRAAAEQALYDQKFMEFATRLHSSIEGASYAGAALKAAKTGAGGQDARNALNFYRMAVSPYESSVIPREALLEGRGDLNDAPYFEALMRTDSAELDNLISKIDKGEEVNPAHFLDALEAYQVNQTAQIKAYAKRLPQHYAEDLRALARGMPKVDKFLSDAARMGRSASKVAPKVSRDYQQGFTLAIKDYAGGVEKSLRDEADRITEEMAKLQREQKNNPRLKAVITAMSHSHDTLEKMADNIQYGLERGTMRGGVSADDVGMLRSMAATHDAAEHLEELYLKYRQIESGFAALPAARTEMEAAPLTERLIDAAELGLTIKTLGGNRAAKAIAPKTISGPVRKIRKTIERRQALKEINKVIEKTK